MQLMPHDKILVEKNQQRISLGEVGKYEYGAGIKYMLVSMLRFSES